MATEHSTDFVWAVRLLKISKGVFSSNWTQRTLSAGATFDMDNKAAGRRGVEKILNEDEGLEGPVVLEVEDANDCVDFIVV